MDPIFAFLRDVKIMKATKNIINLQNVNKLHMLICLSSRRRNFCQHYYPSRTESTLRSTNDVKQLFGQKD